MKNKTKHKLIATLSSSLLWANLAFAEAPTGELTVSTGNNVVLDGTTPALSWNIGYPSTTPPIDPTLTTTAETKVEVRMLGTSIVVGGNKRFTNTEMQFSGSNNWIHIFKGIDTDVDVNEVLVTKTLPKGTTIGFRTQKETGSGGVSSWRYFDPKDTDNHHVNVLFDGSELPWIGTPNNQRSISDFLAGYLNEEQTNIILPSNQIILAVEMGTTSPEDSGYDMQDVILLLTFTETL